MIDKAKLLFNSVILCKPSTKIKEARLDSVQTRLQQLINAGSHKLQVLADFDFTLSRYTLSEDGTKAMTTHAVFEEGNDFLRKLTEKYIVIEYDKNLTVEQKIPHMLQWWKESHNYILSNGYDRKRLEKLVQDVKRLQLRDGCIEFFRVLEKQNVPIVIFSGGIGDAIAIIIKNNLGVSKLPQNIHIISNWMVFDENDRVIDFKNPIVHSFNKNSSVIKEEDKAFFENLRERPNVLLLGDSLGDAHMDVGLESEQNVLKIGFLNKDVDSFMDDYLENFDIVCVNDQTMDVPVDIVKSICS